MAASALASIEAHSASRAWRSRGGDQPSAVETLTSATGRPSWKSSVFRLAGAGLDGSAVVAKRAAAESLAVERRIYEEVLPAIGLHGPRALGWAEGPGEEAWLFLENVEGIPFASEDPRHRALAGTWLGHLHEATALRGPVGFPDRGAEWYLERLETARDRVRWFGLNGLDSRLAALAADWAEVVEACVLAPPGVVHGDFTAKNVLLGADGRLLVLDWDTAGWGPPAPDVPDVDRDAYLAVRRGLDAKTVSRMQNAGNVMRHLLWIEATSTALETRWPERALRKLAEYDAELSRWSPGSRRRLS